MDNKIIQLRPHHLVCLHFYSGHGYDNEFVINMDKVAKAVKAADVEVVGGLDDICFACPNKIESRCISQEKCIRYDNKALELTKIKLGTVGAMASFSKIIIDEILEKDKLKDICFDCTWAFLCHKIMEDGFNSKERFSGEKNK